MNTTKIVVPSYFPKSQIKNDGLNVAVITITPDIARFWLKTYNSGNRKMSRSNVMFLKSQMQNGQWIPMNGDTISFLPDGTLNDGQHRLKALEETGKSFPFLVMVGVDDRSFKVKDTGRKRGASDVLGIEGYKSAVLLASGCKFILNWKQGKYSEVVSGATRGSKPITNTDVSDFAAKNKDIVTKQLKLAYNYYQMSEKGVMTASWVLGFLFLFSEKDVKFAERFMFQLCTGDGLVHGTALYYLRKKLLASAMSETQKIPARTKLALIVKAWNYHRTGKNKKRLVFNPSRGEKFPSIV